MVLPNVLSVMVRKIPGNSIARDNVATLISYSVFGFNFCIFNVTEPALTVRSVRRKEYASWESFLLYNSATPRSSENDGSINVNFTESPSDVLSGTTIFVGGGGGGSGKVTVEI